MSKLKLGLELIKFVSTTERLLAWRKCFRSIVSRGRTVKPCFSKFSREKPVGIEKIPRLCGKKDCCSDCRRQSRICFPVPPGLNSRLASRQIIPRSSSDAPVFLAFHLETLINKRRTISWSLINCASNESNLLIPRLSYTSSLDHRACWTRYASLKRRSAAQFRLRSYLWLENTLVASLLVQWCLTV